MPRIAKGIGLVFTLFLLQIISSLCTNHFFYRSASTGVLLRGGLITAIYTRSLKLTSRARSTLNNGKLVNHISTDVSRIDFCAGYFHMSWTALISLLICLALLIIQLGPSALAGFACFVVWTPLQTVVMRRLFKKRGAGMKWTDKRVKLIQELLSGMKIIKFFAWENPYLEQLAKYRKTEISYGLPSPHPYFLPLLTFALIDSYVPCCSLERRILLSRSACLPSRPLSHSLLTHSRATRLTQLSSSPP